MSKSKSLLHSIQSFLMSRGFECKRTTYKLECQKDDWFVTANSRKKEIVLSWNFEKPADEWEFKEDFSLYGYSTHDVRRGSCPRELEEFLDNVEPYDIDVQVKKSRGSARSIVRESSTAAVFLRWRKRFGFDEFEEFKRYVERLCRLSIYPVVTITIRVREV